MPDLRQNQFRLSTSVAGVFAGDEQADVFQERCSVPFGDMRRSGRDVRGDDDVGHRPQRRIGGQRLGLEDVERGPRDLPDSRAAIRSARSTIAPRPMLTR